MESSGCTSRKWRWGQSGEKESKWCAVDFCRPWWIVFLILHLISNLNLYTSCVVRMLQTIDAWCRGSSACLCYFLLVYLISSWFNFCYHLSVSKSTFLLKYLSFLSLSLSFFLSHPLSFSFSLTFFILSLSLTLSLSLSFSLSLSLSFFLSLSLSLSHSFSLSLSLSLFHSLGLTLCFSLSLHHFYFHALHVVDLNLHSLGQPEQSRTATSLLPIIGG